MIPVSVFIMTTQSTGTQEEDACEFLFKIIFIGDSNVGKTCVIHSFKSGEFRDKHHNTIGVDFTVHSMDIDGKKVKVSTLNCYCHQEPGESVFVFTDANML